MPLLSVGLCSEQKHTDSLALPTPAPPLEGTGGLFLIDCNDPSAVSNLNWLVGRQGQSTIYAYSLATS